MYWIGYLYRYFCYTYDFSSRKVYGLLKPKELRPLYPAYHTLGCDQAIERILESKGISFSEEAELQRQLKILREVRARNLKRVNYPHL